MSSQAVLYNGKSILKEHFRAYVYNGNGEKKLCQSWDDYNESLKSGLWFDSLQAKDDALFKSKPKKEKPKMRSGTFEVSESEMVKELDE